MLTSRFLFGLNLPMIRPVPRGVLFVAALLSLAFAGTVTGVWLRSYRKADSIQRNHHDWTADHYASRRYGIQTARGRVAFSLERRQQALPKSESAELLQAMDVARAERPQGWEFKHTAIPVQPTGFPMPAPSGWLGFAWQDVQFGRRLIIPLWLPWALGILLPGWQVMSWWRARGRRLKHQCRTCGYDLRATPDRCPECGVIPSEADA